MILPMRDQHETLIGIKRPGGGRWTITPEPGSPAIAGVSHANGLPPARIAATVHGRRRARELRYVVRPRAGQTVTFAERAAQVFHVLGDARGTRGQLTFTPASGRAGRREIVALILLSGVQRQQLVVGHYVAPGPVRAAAPRWLRLAHRGPDVVARWGAGAGAQRYAATVSLSDGERLAFSRPPADRSITIRAGISGLGAKVTVMGISPDGNAGAARIARLGPTTPARVHGITAARTRAGVLVRWLAVPSAARYLVFVTVAGARGARYVEASGLPRLAPSKELAALKAGTSVTILVRAISTGGLLGPAGVGRYRVPAARR